MKFLVTGASGFLGYHVCKFLIDNNHEVIGLDINDFEYDDLKEKVKFYKGDIRDKELIEKVSEGVNVIMHGAAALPSESKEVIFDVNLKGMDNILEACVKNKVERLVYISSTAVYGIPEIHPIDEDAPKEGVGAYGETKILDEQKCELYRKKGLTISILRPKTFAGAYRLGVFQIFCDWVYSKKNIPIIGSGKNKYQLLHVEDLVSAIYEVSVAPKENVNDVFNVASNEFKSMKEDLQVVLDYAGYGKRVIPIPSILIIPPLKVFEKLHLSPLYEWVYETADKEHYVSVDKLMRKTNWKPRHSTAEVWLDTYKWYEQNVNNIKKEGTTHRVAWKQGILEVVKWFF